MYLLPYFRSLFCDTYCTCTCIYLLGGKLVGSSPACMRLCLFFLEMLSFLCLTECLGCYVVLPALPSVLLINMHTHTHTHTHILCITLSHIFLLTDCSFADFIHNDLQSLCSLPAPDSTSQLNTGTQCMLAHAYTCTCVCCV